jgi:hypothetical protein
VKTASIIAEPSATPVKQVVELREQDFGFYEGKSFYARPKDGESPKKGMSGKDAHRLAHRDEPGFVDVESRASMDNRCAKLVNEHLSALLEQAGNDEAVIIVAHGIILSHLWRAILARLPANSVVVAPEAMNARAAGAGGVWSLEHLGGWSNTGYLEVDVWREVSHSGEHESQVAKGGNRGESKESGAVEAQEVAADAAADVADVMGPEISVQMEADSSATHERGAPATPPQRMAGDVDQEKVAGDAATTAASNIASPKVLLESFCSEEATPARRLQATRLPQGTDGQVSRPSTKLEGLKARIIAVNSTVHLQGLKKTKGGIGSAKHDESQKTIESFFKKRKIG